MENNLQEQPQEQQLSQQAAQPAPTIVINNVNQNTVSQNMATVAASKRFHKWIYILLAVFTFFGHKFYEGKILMGILYIFTGGLFFIGVVVDVIKALTKTPDENGYIYL